jgi:hypothetical protein
VIATTQTAESIATRERLGARVVEALTELKVRCDGDALTTAWRLAIVWSRTNLWPDTYTEAAVRGMALSLAVGDIAAADRVAQWITDPDAAMDAVLAEAHARKAVRS